MKSKLIYIIVGLTMLMLVSCISQKPAPLIPREVLFGNPDRTNVRISPDGRHISFLAPYEGVLNVWVAPVDQPDQARVVTQDKKRGIRIYFWAYTNEHILYLQDLGGDENWQVHAADIETGEDRNLTPFEEIIGPDGKPMTLPNGKRMRPRASISAVSQKFPDLIMVGLNNRDPQYHDLYKLNILTGDLEMVEKNTEFLGYLIDDDYRVRFAMKTSPDGGNELFVKDVAGNWITFDKIPMEDMMTTWPIGFNKTADTLYMVDSRGRNTAALVALDLKSKEKKVLAEDERADIEDVLIHPTEKTIQAASVNYLREEWKILDDAIAKDFEYLAKVHDGDFKVTNRSLDDSKWTISYSDDDGPVYYYLYDRAERKAKWLFSNRKALEKVKLSPMHPVVIPARDGLKLVSYLTLPVWLAKDAKPKKPLPMVLFVHGGPWARDQWGYNSVHQWLANRGYAVLSVNYRGSTGFGKAFVNAGNKEWAGKMHDDLIDAVNWAVEQGIALKDRIAIMGGSYGGYATLVGLTFTPDVFACGVDMVGPSNLRTLLKSIPPYWKPLMDMWATRIGDPRTEEGRKFLESRSPLNYADRIRKPLLIGQGANDPRVKQTESDQIVKAMQEKGIPVTYIVYPDEGHGFARPENRLSFFAVTEIFLAQYLGGRYEEIGDDFANSTIQVKAGLDLIPGLSEALESK